MGICIWGYDKIFNIIKGERLFFVPGKITEAEC